MTTFTLPNTHFQQRWVTKLSDGYKVCMTLVTLCFLFVINSFTSQVQAQTTCAYDIDLVDGYPKYDAASNTTTFVWSVTNPNPGNGNNGTVQALSW